MRILVISQFYKPDITAAAFRISDFVDFLRAEGHDVLVVTTHPFKSVVEEYDFSNEMGTVRVRISAVKKKGFIGYLKHYFSFMFKSMWAAWKNRKWNYDIIFVSSPPLFVGYAGVWLKRILRKPLFIEIRDIWPDTAVAAGQLGDKGMSYRISRHIEKVIYKKATEIAAVSVPMSKYIKEIRGSDVEVCYNGVPENKINEFREIEENKPSGQYTLGYLGNIGLCQGIEDLVEAAKVIKEKEIHNIIIQVIGEGAQKESLTEKAKDLELTTIIKFDGPFSKGKVEKLVFNDIDILFLNLKSHPVFEKTIPSKVFDYLLYRRPVLYGIEGEGRQIFDDLGIGERYGSGNAEELVDNLLKISENYSDYLGKCYEKNIPVLEEKFTREVNFSKLVNRIEEILEK